MNGTADRLWPGGGRGRWLRLAVALALAPVLVAALMTGLSFLVAASSEATLPAVMAVTQAYGREFLVNAMLLTVGGVLPAIALLWLLARRGALAWLLAGAIGAALLGAALSAMRGQPPVPAAIVSGVLGALLGLTVRWIAGVRRSR